MRPIRRVVAIGTSEPEAHVDLPVATADVLPAVAQAALTRMAAERGVSSMAGLARMVAEEGVGSTAEEKSETESEMAGPSHYTGQDIDAQPRHQMWHRDENKNWELIDEEPFETYQQYRARSEIGLTGRHGYWRHDCPA